jgi:lysylphosphatidylglycerol synthetase-like protein (DUF2156 family)
MRHGGRKGDTPAGLLTRVTVAATLTGAALVHATVMGEHLEEWVPAGIFFLCLLLLESVLGVLALLAWSRVVALLVLASGIVTVAVWTVSRSVGMPIGPADFRVPEAVGAPDLVCAALELAAAAVCAYSLAPRPAVGSSPVHSGPGRRVLAGLVVASVAVVTAVGVAPAMSPGGAHHHHAASSTEVTVPATTP